MKINRGVNNRVVDKFPGFPPLPDEDEYSMEFMDLPPRPVLEPEQPRAEAQNPTDTIETDVDSVETGPVSVPSVSSGNSNACHIIDIDNAEEIPSNPEPPQMPEFQFPEEYMCEGLTILAWAFCMLILFAVVQMFPFKGTIAGLFK